MSTPSIALLGCGYTLQQVARHFSGDQLVVTTTSPEKEIELRTKFSNVALLDLDNRPSVESFFQSFPNISVLVDSIPPASGREHYFSCVRERASALQKIIYLSTTGVYGVTDGSFVSESTPPAPKHERSKLRCVTESAYQQSGVPVCAFRIAAIYGPGRGIGIALRGGRYPFVDGGTRWSNRIHVEDLATSIVRGIKHSAVLPTVINLVDDLPSLTKDVVEYYCQQFNLPRPTPMTAADALERGYDTLLSNQRVDNSLLKSTFSLTLAYPTYKVGAGSEFSSFS
jgi:hypothetical protein